MVRRGEGGWPQGNISKGGEVRKGKLRGNTT